MIKWTITLALFAALAGCNQPEPDECLRRELFNECLAHIPQGPTRAHYNDWSEVVNECGEQAYMMSFRRPSHIRRDSFESAKFNNRRI